MWQEVDGRHVNRPFDLDGLGKVGLTTRRRWTGKASYRGVAICPWVGMLRGEKWARPVLRTESPLVADDVWVQCKKALFRGCSGMNVDPILHTGDGPRPAEWTDLVS